MDRIWKFSVKGEGAGPDIAQGHVRAASEAEARDALGIGGAQLHELQSGRISPGGPDDVICYGNGQHRVEARRCKLDEPSGP